MDQDPGRTTTTAAGGQMFGASTGAIGELIQSVDWSQTSLGPIEQWSPVVTTTVSLMLRSPVPMASLWGPEGTMLYNSGYAEIAGQRHPQIMGGPVLENWPEVADFNANVLRVGLEGGTLTYRDLHMVLMRNGGPEDTWLDLMYSPIVDERGRPIGVLAIVVETTSRVAEERLRREAEERFKLALDAAGMIGVCDYHIAADQLYADARCAEMFGLDPAAGIRGMPLAALLRGVHPEDSAGVRAALQQSGRADEGFALEYRLAQSQGDDTWIFMRGRRIAADDGQPERILAVVVDISEHKRAEAALRDSQAELQLITDELPELVGYVDSTLTYRFTNRAYEEWFGLPRDQILGRRIPDVVSPETWAARRPGLERALAGEEVRMEVGLEMGNRRRDTELRLFPRRDSAGNVVGVYIFVLDISDRKRAEAALRQLNQGLEQEVQSRTRERDRIWSVSRDLLGVADLSGVWRAINPAWERTLGWTEADIVGRTSEWMEHPDDRVATRAEILDLAAGKETLYFENRFRTVDGSYRWLSWTAVPEDNLLYAVARDITAEKERQSELTQMQELLRQSQKMEAVGQLTGGIAHDFNNMLTGVIASLDLLQRRVGAGRLEGFERYVNTATTSAKRAAALTHRLLAFSRRQSLDVQPADVNQLIVSLEDLLRRTLGENIAVATVLKAGLWPALTDANQLENAILNLCINARDAMPEGGQLTLETSNTHLDEVYTRAIDDLAPGDYVVVAVTDTGSGMPPDVIERAFDPFFTTKPQGQGTGLGLSMIYGFVKQLGGHIRIYSEIGQGTTVKLFLPRNSADIELAQTATGEGWAHAVNGEAILVVEDDPAVRMVIVEVLEDLGYQPIEADNGKAAIEQIDAPQRIDLIITDVGLPGMSGRQLADAARERRPDVPILFVTGYAEAAINRSGFLEPGMELISKPFDVDALAAKVRAMLEQR